MYDVIIIGAGPAGSYSAYLLAKNNFRVLILEKQSLPRYKPCGGGIPAEFLQSLDLDFATTVTGAVNKACYYYDLKNPLSVELEEKIIMLNRAKFDAKIAEQAVQSGAELLDQVEISELLFDGNHNTVKTNKGAFQARYLIGADGCHSLIGRKSGLTKKRRISPALEVEVGEKLHDLDTALFGFGQVKGGYVWSFPKSDFFSLGIGGEKALPGRSFVGELKKWLAFLGCKSEPKIYSHPLPMVEPGAKLSTKKILLVGDAAGLVDPLTGEGIRHGLKSSQIAVQAICAGKLSDYSRRIYQDITKDFKFAYYLKWYFSSFFDSTYKFGLKNPQVFKAITEVFFGRLTYRAFLAKIFRPGRIVKLWQKK